MTTRDLTGTVRAAAGTRTTTKENAARAQRGRIVGAFVLGLAGAAGCSGPTPGPSNTAELRAYCEVAGRAGLESWVGDVATSCETTGDDTLCSVTRGDDTLALGDVRRALPAAGNRLVVLYVDDRLALTSASGAVERELAAWASDPWVSPDGTRITWVGLPDGVDVWDFGVPTVIVTEAVAETSRTVLVADDDLASSPRPVPGTDEVVYVSVRTGLGSYWIAGPGHAPRQLTNIGLTEIGQDTIPVASREIAWSDGALFFASDDDRVFRLTLDGTAVEVGPGSWPRTRPDGSVLALQASGDPCAAIYPAGGTP